MFVSCFTRLVFKLQLYRNNIKLKSIGHTVDIRCWSILLSLTRSVPVTRSGHVIRCLRLSWFWALWRTEWFCSLCFFLPSHLSIAFLKLVPIVAAANLWGCAWFRLRVQLLCDNMAVVTVLNSSTSKSPDVMHLLRLLTLEACRKNFIFLAAHTPGRENYAADVSIAPTRVAPLGSSRQSGPPSNSTITALAPGTSCLIHQCFGLLVQDLAPSTPRVYAAGQWAYFQL